MHSSERTKVIAEGIAIYARLMNEVSGTDEHDDAACAWDVWCYRYRNHQGMQEYVIDQQTKLFDRINAREW